MFDADALTSAMKAAGIHPAGAPPLVADGRLRRFALDGDKPRTLNGWITLHDNGDGSHGAAFGNWKTGIKSTWFSGSPRQELTPAERREYAKRMAEARAKQEAEQRQRQEAAAKKARYLWERSTPAEPGNPYLVKKQIKPHGLHQLNESLLVPVSTITRELVGLQFITGDGEKRFLSGTAISGNFYLIGDSITDLVLIAEGVATAATLYEATGHPVTVAFSAGNLRPVAEAIRNHHPQTTIIICADADPVGMAAAQDAAESVAGHWIAPDDHQKETPTNGNRF